MRLQSDKCQYKMHLISHALESKKPQFQYALNSEERIKI